MNEFSLQGKIAVVTGGTGVLGTGMVLGLARAGAKVAILGRRHHAAEEVAERVRQAGGEVLAISADVLVDTDLEDAKTLIIKEWGKIDILVNAAGGNLPGATIPEDKTFFDLDLRDLRTVFDLNFLGTLLPIMVFGKVMAEQKNGVILNISSMTATRPLTRVVGYGAAKAAIDNFTKWLAVEMARKFGPSLRVNAIAPGFFITEQNRTLLTNPDGGLTARGQAILTHTPMARFGDPDDLTGTLVWLCSDAARFVTGVVVPVDGGFLAYSGV
jgi:NAD(P)-dependent dehydrogenase (short-subunit alcohol dehydrogenase family)